MLSECSAPGVQDEWLTLQSAITPVSGSRYLEYCEDKPEILFKTIFFAPLRTKEFVNPFFLDFLSLHPEFEVSQQYYHATQTDEAFKLALSKYCKKRTIEDPEEPLIKLADDWVFEILKPVVSGCVPMSVQHILSKVDLGASPGPLWRYLTETKEGFVLDPDGEEILREYLLLMDYTGSRSYWGANLKQELRLLEKVRQNKTRIFMAAPTEHFLVASTFSWDFNNRLIIGAKHLLTPIAIGLSIFHGTFDKIGKVLENFPHKYCMDVSGYDTSIRPWEQVSMCNLRLRSFDPRFLTPQLFNTVVNTYKDINKTPLVLPDGVVILVPAQPSGHANTGIDNSIHLLRRLILTWLSSGGRRDYACFCENVYLLLAGDDSIIALSDYAHQFINQKTLEHTFMKFYGCEVEFSEQLEFLGHYFLHDGDTYFPGFSHSRVVAALGYKGGVTAAKNLELACSLQVESYSCAKTQRLIKLYIDHLLLQFPDLRPQFIEQYHNNDKLASLFGIDLNLQSRTNCVSKKVHMSKKIELVVQKQQKNNNNNNSNAKKRKPRKRKPRSQRQNNSNNNKPQLPGAMYAAAKQDPTSKDHDKTGCDYVAMLVNPRGKIVRYPDSQNKSTALIRTERYIDVVVDPALNGGAFSCLLQAQLGNPANASTLKTALVLDTLDWATANWSDVASYSVNQANNVTTAGSATDIRMDPLTQKLVCPPLSQLFLIGQNYPVVAPLGTNVIDDPSSESYGLPYLYEGNGSGASGFNESRIYLSPGMYTVELRTTTLAADDPTCVITVNAGSQIKDQGFFDAIIGGTAISVRDSVVVINGPNGYISMTGATLPTNWTGGSIHIGSAFSPDMLDDLNKPMIIPYDFGDISTMRPVAMSALFTCTTATAYTGGRIASARLESSQAQEKYFTRSSKQLQYYSNLSVLNKARDGQLVDGAYIYYAPDDEDDSRLLKPSDCNNHNYPSLLFSGIWTPTNAPAGPQVIGRILQTTVYEFTTTQQLYDQATACCPDFHRQKAMMLLQDVPWTTANAEHETFIQRMMAKIRGAYSATKNFYVKNKSFIDPLVGVGLSLL